ncbi:NADP-dependent oxidoreductase [Nocardia sp. NPDC004068]|uniref:NADP-dependent oxidoreductase n=1 Tax=Nocardia sp. NPDC004068 TaxID=3364303 RepID=UPI0036B2A457
MKAVRYHRYGDTDVLVREEVSRPSPGAGEVLVKVAASAFNPVDTALRAGYLAEVFPTTFPRTPGIDVAGTVAELGAGVSDWNVGDAVVAMLPMTGDGSAAEYVLAPADALAAAPHTTPLADAASLPVVGLTAWQALFEHAELKAGQTILINGAGSAVGGYAVQLAKRAGAIVTGTAGARSADRLRAYGIDRILGHLDYSTRPLAVPGQPFDVVLDLVPTTPEETADLVALTADGGIFVSTTTPAAEDTDRVRTARVFVRPDAARLSELVAAVDAGDLRLDVADRRPLTELAAVHADADAGRLPGKTILIP